MTEKLPTVLCTSVIRSSQQGESHGGMYLVDLEAGAFRQVVDWNDQAIDWQGRGADRGLRGLAFYNGRIIAAASDEVFVYSQNFQVIKSFRNRYLKHCHEICIDGHRLYLSSTGFDAILVFDLPSEKFVKGYCYRDDREANNNGLLSKIAGKFGGEKKSFSIFDPENVAGPTPNDTHHINNVFVHDGNIYFSGTKMDALMCIRTNDQLEHAQEIPKGTHNVQFYNGQLLMNNTAADAVLMENGNGKPVARYDIPTYPPDTLLHNALPNDHARQAFGRGLCTFGDLIIAGSSPATLSVYRADQAPPLKSINLTMDVRNAIHGLEVYPYVAAAEPMAYLSTHVAESRRS